MPKKGKSKTQIKKKKSPLNQQHFIQANTSPSQGSSEVALPPPKHAVGRDLHIKYPLPQTAEAETLGERKKICFQLFSSPFK